MQDLEGQSEELALDLLDRWFSKYSPRTDSGTWDLVKNADGQAPTQTC